MLSWNPGKSWHYLGIWDLWLYRLLLETHKVAMGAL